ncbi:hypothetical protein [Streptomyces sp. NPDC047869]|uniref:hypothetical protein n=1 Tax=Streptomyces sp. NPDC047869 TaxID=3154709 RepID=UPI003452F119
MRRTSAAGPERAAGQVAAFRARDDRVEAFDALAQAIEQGRPASALRQCLTHAWAAASGGVGAEENTLLRRAADLLLRSERGVGVSAPPTSSRRKRGQLPPRSPNNRAPARSSASPGRTAADAVTDLLHTLDRRRGHFTLGEQRRLLTRLEDRARLAAPWISGRVRERIAYWRRHTPPAPLTPRKATAPTPSPPPTRAGRQEAPPAGPRTIERVADAARAVLEHSARSANPSPGSRCARRSAACKPSVKRRSAAPWRRRAPVPVSGRC